MTRTTLPILALALSSCASIMNSDLQRVRVAAGGATASVRVGDDSVSHPLPAELELRRSAEPTILHIDAEEARRTLLLEPHLSGWFVLGNVIAPPIGHLLDLGSDRRWAYDEEIHVDLDDSSRGYPSWRVGISLPGDLRLGWQVNAMTLTYVSLMSLDTGGGRWRAGSPFLNAMVSLDRYSTSEFFVGVALRGLTSVVGECFDSCPPSALHLSLSLHSGNDLGPLRLTYGVRGGQLFLRTRDPAGSIRSFTTIGPTASIAYRVSSHVAFMVEHTSALNVGPDRTGGGYSNDWTFGLFFSTARGER